MVELIGLFWIADIMNLPFMEMFDTVYALNGLFWFLGWIWILILFLGWIWILILNSDGSSGGSNGQE